MQSPSPVGNRLLVVEDSDVTRECLTAVLRQAGYAVRQAGDGREALNRLWEDPPPDLIVLDMLLPVLDGWHFLEQLKADARLAAVPIVVTTATVLSQEWAATHGCAGFLRKPFEPEDLLAEVRRCLDAAMPADTHPVAGGRR